MRSEEEMMALILDTARNDERIRAVILNGSRANPHAPRDIFQDYDIVYLVTDVASLKQDTRWLDRFGELMIRQMPEAMSDPPARDEDRFTWLMQFMDGNRLDLTLYPLANLEELEGDSLSVLLLDKDGRIPPFPPPNESDYLPQPPSAKAYANCCNEFWWVSTYVAKGLWREEILYAKHMMDRVVRPELLKMLTWYIGVQTDFSQNPGKFGKYFQQYLPPEMWEALLETFADASYRQTWSALLAMGDLFRKTAVFVADHFHYSYPYGDDDRVSAHLRHVQQLPKNVGEIY